MVDIAELRPGNYVFAGTMGCESFSGTILKIRGMSNNDYVDYVLDYPDSDSLEDESSSSEGLYPVPLNKTWKKILNVNFEYPSWIKSVHELQNWYYWNNAKKELDTSLVPMSEGDNVDTSRLEELIRED